MPPINPTIARIDVMVNGQRNIDRLADSYLAVERNARTAGRSIQNLGVSQTGFGRGVGGILQQINNFSTRLASHTQQVNAANRATGSWGGSILKLTRSMVLFSVLLPLVKLPETVIRSFSNFVDVGVEWEHNLRSINSLLNLQGDQYTQYNNTLRATTVQYGLMGDEVGGAVKQIASTLGVLQRNTQGLDAAQRAQQDMNDTLALTDKIAKLSRSSFEDMNSVQEAAFTMLSSGKLTLDQADQAFDSLFRTVQVGRTTFDQFNKSAGQFIPLAQDWIDAAGEGADNASARFERLTGVLNAFEAASMTLGSAKAATGLGQIFQALSRGSGAQSQMVQMTENMRRIQGLGQQYDITPQGLYATGNVQDVFAKIRNVMGPQGLLVTQYVNQLKTFGRLQDETAARASRSHFLLTQYLGNVRAARAFEAIDPNSLAEAATAHAAAPGEAGGFEQYQQDPKAAADRASRAMEVVKVNVFDAMQKAFIGLNLGVANLFDDISKQIEGGAGGQSVFTRLAYIGGRIIDAFSNWYTTGGKRQVAQFGHDLGAFIANAITSFFGGKDGQNAIADAAITFSKAFAGAVAENLPQLLGAVLSSAIGQAVVSYLTYKMGGAPTAVAGIGAVATTAGLQSGGLPGQIAGGAALGFGLLTAGKVLWNRPLRYTGTGDSRVGVAGTSPGEIFMNSRAGAIARRGGPQYTGAGFISGGERGYRGALRDQVWAVDPVTGNPMPGVVATVPGIANRRTLTTAGGSSTGRKLQMAGGLGTSAALLAIGAMQAMNANPGERSRAMGGAIGSTAGMLLGGLLGSIPAVMSAGIGIPVAIAGGLGGQMLGGHLGEMAGGALAPWLEPLLSGGQGPTAATGDQELQAQNTLSNGIDSSQMARDIEQMNRQMQANGTGFGGVAVATKTAGASAPGTGGGPLSNNFIDQYDPASPLTKSQADAACGPAATAFFTKAYGRNPTLQEAYNLQNQIQGGGAVGFDIANHGGSAIGSMVGAINQMAGADVATAHSTGDKDWRGVDWGALAEGAKAGIPGVVNVGPNKNFPGHYFQIAGYNPATNQFNVGTSGTNLRGGKAWMTPEEMQAFGPGIGYITGTNAGLAGTGGGGVAGAATRNGGFDLNVSNPYAQQAYDIAIKAGMDPAGAQIFARQIGWESGNWSADVVSGKRHSTAGAVGIAQIMPDVAAAAGVNPLDPTAALTYAANRDVGALKTYGGDWKKVLAAYNAGPGNLQQYGLSGVMSKDFAGGQTLSYINKILGTDSGTGTGNGPMGGGGVTVNGPLIGTVVLGAGSTEDQANELANILADLLDESHLTSGGSIGQNRLLTP